MACDFERKIVAVQLLAAVVSHYKSIDFCEIPLDGLTVLLGPNGAGKTNVIEALAVHDPILRANLTASRRLTRSPESRIGLVIRFDTYHDGDGPDSDLLRELIVAQWLTGLDPSDLAIEYGDYCESAWWLYAESTLLDENDQRTLSDCLRVVKESILAGVHPEHLPIARSFVDAVFDQPVLIIQEDFAIELSFDPGDPNIQSALAVKIDSGDRQSAFYDMLGALHHSRGRWWPLIRLSTCLPEGRSSAAGFDWVIDRFGGIAVLSGDVDTLEHHLDSMLPKIHDQLLHRPDDDDDLGVPESGCTRCMSADHGGRVDPLVYQQYERELDSMLPYRYKANPNWLDEEDGWFRVRPGLQTVLRIVEEEANRSLPEFVAERGVVRIVFRPIPEWDNDGTARCEVRFLEFDQDADTAANAAADHEGTSPHADRRAVPQSLSEWRISELGHGFQRWIATAVRLAADRCADGEIEVFAGPTGAPGTPIEDNPPVQLSYTGASVRPKILLIDEPEQHLHIDAQHQAALWCMAQARQNHAVLVASHSPAFAALPPERATTCKVTREGRKTVLKELPPVHGPDAVARARDLGFELGMGRTALAQFTRAVLVVEGEWDCQLLYAFFLKDLAAQRILVVPLQGSEELLALADAAVIPALGVPTIALLDEVRATSPSDFAELPAPLSKAERGLRDLSAALGEALRIVRYEDPDVICALPEAAVRRAFPHARFPGWDLLLTEWRNERDAGSTNDSFKKWALKSTGLPSKERFPTRFFRTVLGALVPGDQPGKQLTNAVKQVLAHVGEQDADTRSGHPRSV
jgi:hypothetical protein